ncbi:MAG: branched-chain amino acid ABC transporter permease [Rhodoblastus sp.]|nr:branched-chain amino acid ABC transporter permease [Rhodoblastus sp.]MCO5087857.1 branched-chain amino acid ABC transporter permease [Methylobacteriaceae bacterium]HPG03884.1 branched-chain amino acid ABC transporter permease [Rhodoblastus sp.]
MKGALSFLTPRSTIALLVCGVALLIAPFVVDRYTLSIILLALLGTYLGQAWNILMGYCGLLSLGHALYLGLGAYASAILFVNYGVGPWLSVFVAMALAVGAAAVLGWLGFRFRIEGVYFSLLTIAFAEIVRIGFDNWSFVGGAAGFFLPVNASLSHQWWNLRGGPLFFYYLALAMAVASLVIAAVLRSSKLGYAFLAIREDPQAARALGVNINRTRFLALFISAAMTAVGGVYLAFWTNNLFPAQILETSKSIEIILAPIIGGLGTLMGPFVGAFLLVPLGSALTDGLRAIGLSAPGVKALVYGLILMAIIAATPNGIWPWLARKLGLEAREP